VDARSPAAIPEVASVEVVEVLLKHSAAGSITSRRYGSQPVDAPEVLVDTRRLTEAAAATAALDDLIGEAGEAWVKSKAGQLAKFGAAPLFAVAVGQTWRLVRI
jgi:hypothetical protein